MSKPKVTIAIPTYNRAKYLGDAIESALNQDYPELEIIVSDNASIDNTLEIIDKYKTDPRFFFYRTEDNQGARGNWEKLLYKYSTGDWFMILGSDDYLLDNAYISKCMKITDQDPAIVLCHGNVRTLYEQEQQYEDTDKKCPPITEGGWYFWDIKRAVQIHIATAVFNREKAIKLQAFQKDYIGGDAELIGKLLLTGKVGFIDSLAAAYRFHGGNDTYTASLDNILDHCRCYDGIYEFGLLIHSEKKKELLLWRKEWQRAFFKGYYYNLVKHDKSKAFSFLLKALIRHPLIILGIYSRPHNLAALLLSIVLTKPAFKKMQEKHALRAKHELS